MTDGFEHVPDGRTKPQFIVCRVASQSTTAYAGSLEIENRGHGEALIRVHGTDSVRAVVRLDADQLADLLDILSGIERQGWDEDPDDPPAGKGM